MLIIIKRASAPKPNCWVLAFHDSYGKAIALPHFTPTTLVQANRIMLELEMNGVVTDDGHYVYRPRTKMPNFTFATGAKDSLNTESHDRRFAEPEMMIGQRVLYGNVICTVCKPEHLNSPPDYLWLDNPEKGYKHSAAAHNVKPLPGGQL